MREYMTKEYYQEIKEAHKQLEEAVRAAGFSIMKGLSQEAKKDFAAYVQEVEDQVYSQQVQAEDEIENIEHLESQGETA